MRRNRQLELAVALFMAFVLLACGANQRKTTLKVTFDAVQVAEKSFTAWDKSHQDKIVENATSVMDGSMRLAAYRHSRDPVELAFVAAYRTIATAMYFDNDETLTGALLAFRTLQDAIEQVTGRSFP